MKTVIVDDELNAREGLKEILVKYFSETIEVVATAEDVSSGIETIEKYNPDLIFLDIKMPDGTGFDVLKKIEHLSCEVIFVTAYDEFAIKAFQFSAFGYLLKPIKISDLRSVIERLNSKLDEKKSNDGRTKILIENYEAEGNKVKKIVIPNLAGFDILEIKKILRLEGDKNYTRFICEEEAPILVSKTLKTYEDLLHDHGFIRVHQSTIVNLHHVKKYMKGDGGEVQMSDGQMIKVARQRKEAFLEKFL